MDVSLVGRVGVDSLSGTIHRPVRVHFQPQSTVRPLYVTKHPIFVNLTSHPALHSLVVDIREWLAKPGMIWASLAAAGSLGRSSMHV